LVQTCVQVGAALPPLLLPEELPLLDPELPLLLPLEPELLPLEPLLDPLDPLDPLEEPLPELPLEPLLELLLLPLPELPLPELPLDDDPDPLLELPLSDVPVWFGPGRSVVPPYGPPRGSSAPPQPIVSPARATTVAAKTPTKRMYRPFPSPNRGGSLRCERPEVSRGPTSAT
jgi:hypothetical protein